MNYWIDAQLPPSLGVWLSAEFAIDAVPMRDLGLRDATDRAIFDAARAANVVLISKDVDFVGLVERFGPPPQPLWVTCGNVSNDRLQQVFKAAFQAARRLLEDGEAIVEVGDKAAP